MTGEQLPLGGDPLPFAFLVALRGLEDSRGLGRSSILPETYIVDADGLHTVACVVDGRRLCAIRRASCHDAAAAIFAAMTET